MSLKVEGFEELFKRMDELSAEIGKGKTDRIWRKVMTTAMQPVLDAARRNSPVDTGQLERGIYLKVHKPAGRDKGSKYYAGEMYMARVTTSTIREDTKLGFVLNKRGKFQTVRQNTHPVAISQEFGNAKTAAHPFLRPSLESNVQNVTDILGKETWAVIDKLAKGK
jgi:HK97 gp10 family phage protein